MHICTIVCSYSIFCQTRQRHRLEPNYQAISLNRVEESSVMVSGVLVERSFGRYNDQ
jgi:hypothetical protein